MNILNLFSILFLQCISSQSFEDDACTLASTGVNGQCVLLSKCSSAIEDIQQKKIFPQNCGFAHQEPIVCCGANTLSFSTSQRVTIRTTHPTQSSLRSFPTTTIRFNQRINYNVGDRAIAKCGEYAQYAYTSANVPSAGRGSSYDNVCVLSEDKDVESGQAANSREFPHMALVGYQVNDNQVIWDCSGSLISEKFVLTAAHCLHNQKYGEPQFVRLGELVLNSNLDDAKPQDYNIINQFQPTKYHPPVRQNDIALLELDKTVQLNSYIRPACLNVKPKIVDRLAVASGWRRTGGGRISNQLSKVALEILTVNECNNIYQSGLLHETEICAGSPSDDSDICYGDSGGPLQKLNSEINCMYDVIGITSFGKTCGLKVVPGIYTRVSAFIHWIEDIVWP